jgi:predicted  nucleic acid-binding Zn-ribbon protein
MPHQCIHCSKIIEAGSKEILDGCSKCGGRFFFYIRDDVAKKMQEEKSVPLQEFSGKEKDRMESDVRQILKVEDEDQPVILDIESVRVVSPGKFEIDLVSLLNRKPIVFKLQEGKYMIDIESSMPVKKNDNPEENIDKKN